MLEQRHNISKNTHLCLEVMAYLLKLVWHTSTINLESIKRNLVRSATFPLKCLNKVIAGGKLFWCSKSFLLLKSIGVLFISVDAYPFAVAVWHLQDGFMCAGALISYQHVLTAGHCVDKPNALKTIYVSYFQSVLIDRCQFFWHAVMKKLHSSWLMVHFNCTVVWCYLNRSSGEFW